MDRWTSGFYPRYPPDMYSFNPTVNIPTQDNSANLIGTNHVSAVIVNSEDSSYEAGSASDKPTYTHYVKIINPKKKSDYIVRMWHSAKHAFKSPSELKKSLMDSFPAEVPSTTNFQVGYLEPPNNSKRWLVEERDFVAMYETSEPGSKITLWCDAKTTEENSTVENEPPSKRKKTLRDTQEEETEEIFTELHARHPDMASPKLRLWSKLIQSGRHDDYDEPPNIPLINGALKPKKTSVASALTGAASAIVSAISGSPRKAKVSGNEGTMSPLKMTAIRRNCLDDLKKLKELFEDKVLTEQEFAEEKKHILSTLRSLK